MDRPETYDVWVVSDADGPVLYFPVSEGSTLAPADHVAFHRRLAATGTSPDGLIFGVWTRARDRLSSGARLMAEVADTEVETRRAAQRAATLARGADAAAWAPDELLVEPEPTARPARAAATPRAPRTSRATTSRAPRVAATAPARKVTVEPEEAVCRSCFMMRRVETLEDGICEFCR
jgi:hypothetical protein